MSDDLAHPEIEIGARALSPRDARADRRKACWSPKVTTKNGIKSMAFDGWATGKGTVIAVFDTGIDVSYPGFVTVGGKKDDPTFTSRIIAYWDTYFDQPTQADTDQVAKLTGLPKSEAVGKIWLRSDIEAFLTKQYGKKRSATATRHPGMDRDGHGTACAALAASHGFAADEDAPIGVAPEADLIAVALVSNCHDMKRWIGTASGKPQEASFSDDQTTVALKFARRMADAHGKATTSANAGETPLVVSMSYGRSNAFAHHDEVSDPFGVFMVGRLNRSGTVLVTGAGNDNTSVSAGTTQGHWDAVVTGSAPASGASGLHRVTLPITVFDDRNTTLDHGGQLCKSSTIPRPLAHSVYFTIGVRRSLRDIQAAGHANPKCAIYLQDQLVTSKGRRIDLHLDGKKSNPAQQSAPIDGKSYGNTLISLGPLYDLTVNISGSVSAHGGLNDASFMSFWATFSLDGVAASGAHCTQQKNLKAPHGVWIELELPKDAKVVATSEIPKSSYGVAIGPRLLDVTKDNAPGAKPEDFVSTASSVTFTNAAEHRIVGPNVLEEQITVAATELGNRTKMYWFSSRGLLPDFFAGEKLPIKPNLAAPGAKITIPNQTGTPASWRTKGDQEKSKKPLPLKDGTFAVYATEQSQGTSFSCPLVSGTAALMLEKRPKSTWIEIEQWLRDTADSTGLGTVPNGDFGAGTLRTAEAVKKAADTP